MVIAILAGMLLPALSKAKAKGQGIFCLNDGQSFGDLPSSYHNGACGFGFADGHAEIHRWSEAYTRQPVKKAFSHPNWQASLPKSRDLQWLFERSTARR